MDLYLRASMGVVRIRAAVTAVQRAPERLTRSSDGIAQTLARVLQNESRYAAGAQGFGSATAQDGASVQSRVLSNRANLQASPCGFTPLAAC